MNNFEKNPNKKVGVIKTIIFSLIPLLILLFSLEILARVIEIWYPPMIMDIGLGFTEDSKLFIADPSSSQYLITNPNKVIAFQPQRFPARKEKGTYRIFFLGGSSVNYVNYELPGLAQRIKEKFHPKIKKVEIINCGGLSYGSHRLVLIAREVANYEPDLALIYSAHNEFEEIEQLDLAKIKTTKLQKVLYSFAFMRFVRDRVAQYQISKLKAEHNRRLLAQSLPDASKGWLHKFTPEEIGERMKKYEENLREIIHTFREKNADVIIATVPSNLVKPCLFGESAEEYQKVLNLMSAGKYEEAYELGRKILKNTSPRHQSSDNENEIIRRISTELNVPLADVYEAVRKAEPHGIPGETLFNDHCHLNPEGNKIMIKCFEEKIYELLSSKLSS
ncbi:MAG: SGNH/GDSL hydrolase family protein [Candidatus Hydrogenedentes bacterium]|nr:SGNH/GDSL hydrolase family protein [Candidatus Hydrogenedentota bacterium]